MRVAIIENMAGTPHGQLGVALQEVKADVHVIHAYAGEPLPAGAHDHDALIVLGGEQNALDDTLYPYLPELALLMKAFGDANKAVMGVCLGSQLLARAYGERIFWPGRPNSAGKTYRSRRRACPILYWQGSKDILHFPVALRYIHPSARGDTACHQ